MLHVAHRLKTSGTPTLAFMKANGMFVTMGSSNDDMHMASCIFSPELQYKWMLMVTALVNGIEALCWSLDSSSWLILQLPPDSFNYTLNIDVGCVADARNVSGTKHGSGSTPVAVLYKNGPEFRSVLPCTTMTSDIYILRLISEVGNVTRGTHRWDIVIGQHRYEESIGNWGLSALCTLMPWQTIVSHILIKNQNPIINNPHMHVSTALVTWMKSSGARQCYINMGNGSNTDLRERITGVVSTPASLMGKMKLLASHWRVICLIITVLILGPT